MSRICFKIIMAWSWFLKTWNLIFPLVTPEILIHQETGDAMRFSPWPPEVGHSFPHFRAHTRANFRQTGQSVPNCSQVGPANKGFWSALRHKLKLPTLRTLRAKLPFPGNVTKGKCCRWNGAWECVTLDHLQHQSRPPKFPFPFFPSLLHLLVFTLECQILQGRGLCLFTDELQHPEQRLAQAGAQWPFPPPAVLRQTDR